LDKEATASRTN